MIQSLNVSTFQVRVAMATDVPYHVVVYMFRQIRLLLISKYVVATDTPQILVLRGSCIDMTTTRRYLVVMETILNCFCCFSFYL